MSMCTQYSSESVGKSFIGAQASCMGRDCGRISIDRPHAGPHTSYFVFTLTALRRDGARSIVWLCMREGVEGLPPEVFFHFVFYYILGSGLSQAAALSILSKKFEP